MDIQQEINRLTTARENADKLLAFIGQHFNFLAETQPLRVEVLDASLFFYSGQAGQLAAYFGDTGWTRNRTTFLGSTEVFKLVDDIKVFFYQEQPAVAPEAINLSAA